jgi:hypothetical protein
MHIGFRGFVKDTDFPDALFRGLGSEKLKQGKRLPFGRVLLPLSNSSLYKFLKSKQMNYKSFFSLAISKLSIDYFYGLVTSTLTLARGVLAQLSPLCSSVLTRLGAAVEVLDASIKKEAGSVLTAQLLAVDKLRDELHREIRRGISMHLKSSQADKKDAAASLKVFYTPFWDMDAKAMDAQTALTTDMLGRYKNSPDLMAQAVLVGLDGIFSQLEEKNTSFDTLYKTRNTEQALQKLPAASSLRKEAVQAYNDFCQALELEVNYIPTEVTTQLFNELNALRSKYSSLVSRSNQEEETPEVEVS